MALVSQLELPGSPSEQGSAETVPYTWQPVLLAGESCTAATATATEYDPRYPNDTKDVSTTVVPTPPTVANGVITTVVTALTAGYEYRVLIKTTLAANHTETRYIRVRCQL